MDRLDLLPPGCGAAASAYLATLRAGASQRAMRRALAKVAVLVARFPTKDGQPLGGYERVDLDRVPWAALSVEHLAQLRDQLATAAPATVRQAMCAVRGVLGAVVALDAEKAAATRVAVPKRRALAEWRPPAPLAGAPAGAAADPRAAGAPGAPAAPLAGAALRDAALDALVRGLGLRPGVAVALDLADFRGWRLDVRKAGRVRTVRLPDPISDAVEAWINVRGSQPGPLLLATNKGGRMLGRLTSGGAQKRLALMRVSQKRTVLRQDAGA